jgi:hypothetical protein
VAQYGEPDRWTSNDFLKCLRVKKNGYYTYWREWRECEDKYVLRWGELLLYALSKLLAQVPQPGEDLHLLSRPAPPSTPPPSPPLYP